MNDTTTTTRESIALTLRHLADMVISDDSDGMRHTIAITEIVARRMETLRGAIAREEYFECAKCGSDFHTAREIGGQECRELQNAN